MEASPEAVGVPAPRKAPVAAAVGPLFPPAQVRWGGYLVPLAVVVALTRTATRAEGVSARTVAALA
jgi:hypothetical protein